MHRSKHPNGPYMCSSRGPGRSAVLVPRKTGSQGPEKGPEKGLPIPSLSSTTIWLLHHPQSVPTVYLCS